ncbi:hypothetical protein OAO87_02310 [bacterium]|nr:hypothetical protein [bacterium]
MASTPEAVHVVGFDSDVVQAEEVRDYMSQVGAVVRAEILDKSTRKAIPHRSKFKGRAIVIYATAAAAKRACQELNGKTMYTLAMEGYMLAVSKWQGPRPAASEETQLGGSSARPTEPQRRSSAGRARPPPSHDSPYSEAPSAELRLFVSWSKHEQWSEADIRSFLENDGTILSVALARNGPFANVCLRGVSARLTALVEASTKAHPAIFENDGWRLWLQHWTEPRSGITRPTPAAASSAPAPAEAAPAEAASAVPASRTVLVTHFAFQTTAEELHAHCSRVDHVEQVLLLPRRPALHMGGRALVVFRHAW